MASPSPNHAQGRGVLYALVAAVLFGASAPFAKMLVEDSSPQLVAGLLYLGSGVGLFIVSTLRRGARERTEARLSRRDAPWLAAAILSGGVLGPVLLMIGLAHTPASSASLLLNLEGVFTATLAWVVFRENVDRRIALGMFAIVVGGRSCRGKAARILVALSVRSPSRARACVGASTTISRRKFPVAIRFKSRCSRASLPARSTPGLPHSSARTGLTSQH